MKIHGLTRTQWEVAVRIAQGKRDKEIGRELVMSPKTVSFHVRQIAVVWSLTGNARVEIANKVRDVERFTGNPPTFKTFDNSVSKPAA